MKLKGETLFLAFIFLLVSFGAIALFLLSGSRNSKIDSDAKNILVRSNSQTIGSQEAKAVLVEFGDFQCPACKSVEPILQKLREQYKDKLKLVFRHFPLPNHRNAFLAAKASEAASVQEKFWEYHDLLYDNQGEWSVASNPREKFLGYANKVGLEAEKFKEDFESNNFDQKIKADKADGEELGVLGTPTFYLNGERLVGNYSMEFFKNEIDRRLAGQDK